ncbi:DUF4345 domain-containing protein [Actinokineospora globicatena]|uniref:DUF4345 domain-containing protein n=1 Tax=Actinokineospora globicatena TaxID=103729 RepID=UPI002555E76A|nr:DUF4345 domain-containing protein [Actinokineospora globicatena]
MTTEPVVTKRPAASNGPAATKPVVNKVVLAIAGLVAVVIGGALLFVPVGFHELSGLTAATDPGNVSEVRAGGAAVLIAGAVIMRGAFKPTLTRFAALVGTGFFLAYGVGRLIGIVADGLPPSGIVTAMVSELVLGVACASVVARTRDRAPV